MSKRWFILSFSLAIILILGGIPRVFAQEASSDEFTLEEITVTAQKRAENQQKVAIPMDVITGDQLAETGKMNVDDILGNLSNVMINYASDGMRITVRGLAETDGTMNDVHVSSPTVAVNIDGAFNSSSSAGQNLFDVERVEVLYGPQSTMYASNSPGGIINVVTSAPKTDKYSASASLEIGNYNLFTSQAMVNAPIVQDKLAMRLAVQMQKRDPYVSGSDQTGENTKSARFKTLYQPNDDFSATVTVSWSKKVNGGMMGGQVIPFDTQDGYWYTSPAGAPPGTPMTKGGKVTDPWTAAPASSGMAAAPDSAAQYTKGISGDIRWNTGIGSLSIVPNYSKTTSDDQGQITSGPDTYTAYTEMRGKQKGVEARLTSNEDFFFEWILGVNYYDSQSYQYVTYSNGSTPTYFDVSDKSKAIFGNITYPFTDKFRGNGGMRYSSDKTQSIGGLFGSANAPAYKSPDYKLGVEYDLAENSMLYATWATSYRVSALRTGLEPEKDKTYTVGTKNRFLGNKLQVNASAYYYDYKNVQIQATGLSTSSGINESQVRDPDGNLLDLDGNGIYGEDKIVTSIAGNTGPPGSIEDPLSQFQTGAFRTIGVDVSADWMLTARDKMNIAVTYLNSEWSDCVQNAYYKSASGGAYWPGDGKNYNGRTRAFSPTLTGNLGYEHNFELGTSGTLVPHIDFMYKSHYILDFDPSVVSYQESYYTVNGNVTFAHASGIWSINAYIKNATNYAAKNMIMSGSLSISDPRTYGAVLSMKF
jgi:iron complex outermembrane recepter protein